MTKKGLGLVASVVFIISSVFIYQNCGEGFEGADDEFFEDVQLSKQGDFCYAPANSTYKSPTHKGRSAYEIVDANGNVVSRKTCAPGLFKRVERCRRAVIPYTNDCGSPWTVQCGCLWTNCHNSTGEHHGIFYYNFGNLAAKCVNTTINYTKKHCDTITQPCSGTTANIPDSTSPEEEDPTPVVNNDNVDTNNIDEEPKVRAPAGGCNDIKVALNCTKGGDSAKAYGTTNCSGVKIGSICRNKLTLNGETLDANLSNVSFICRNSGLQIESSRCFLKGGSTAPTGGTQNPRPPKGNFTCQANGKLFYSNGAHYCSNFCPTHGCKGVNLRFDGACKGQVCSNQ